MKSAWDYLLAEPYTWIFYCFFAERKRSLEKLSFQSSQVSGRIITKTELLPAGFLTLLQVRTQVAPPLIIAGLKLLGREALLSGDDSSDYADGTAPTTPGMAPRRPVARRS